MEYVKFWGMIPTPSALLGLLKGWRTPANKLLANCYQITVCDWASFCFLRQTRQSGKFLATRQVFGNLAKCT